MELDAAVARLDALAFLGYDGQPLDAGFEERFCRAVALCEGELVARGVYRIVAVEEALAVLPGTDIAAHLQGCTHAAFMAVTLGVASEMLLRREYALSATDGLIADACASSMAEQAADALNGIINAEATARGMVATWRFSPGYGDLPLSCQQDVLHLSGADKALGLRVNEADLLVPAKSITAVLGLGADEGHSADGSVYCRFCALAPTCSLRAKGRTCHGNEA